MIRLFIALVSVLLMAASGLAASLQTAARVELVAPTGAQLIAATADSTGWQVTAEVDTGLQIRLETRDEHGHLVDTSRDLATLAQGGHVAAALPTSTDPHTALPVVTLVLIRE